jgi:hypothetical protein
MRCRSRIWTEQEVLFCAGRETLDLRWAAHGIALLRDYSSGLHCVVEPSLRHFGHRSGNWQGTVKSMSHMDAATPLVPLGGCQSRRGEYRWVLNGARDYVGGCWDLASFAALEVD